IGLMAPVRTAEIDFGSEDASEAVTHEGEAWFRVGGELRAATTRYYDREALKAGNRLQGPAIVNQYNSTTVIPPGLSAHVDRFGNIVIETGVLAEAAESAAGAVAGA